MSQNGTKVSLLSDVCVEEGGIQPPLPAMGNAKLELQVGRWINGDKSCNLESTLVLSRPPGAAAWCQPSAEEPRLSASDSYPFCRAALRSADDRTAKWCYE